MASNKFILLLGLLVLLVVSGVSQTAREEGIDLYQQEKYDQAIARLQTVVKTDKKDQLAWVYLGASLFRGGHSDDAIRAFRKGGARIDDILTGYDKQLEIVSKPRPRYTDAARQNNVKGTVRIALEFLANGQIGFAVPIQELPDGLTQNALAAAKSIKFTPARKNGKPVAVVVIIENSFDIY